ncbi:fimbria/pilus outer membrane usher protein [Ventosimonas gracilis]|uniref:fimbria/pilus outer membrane usher protein n=1 Tax=Ventosimonas gracilis TaxID=1680762 RepID=UPI0009A1A0B8|nr:fimbria/pilus outer membrane usher protein [Ventosimonas gracilis]
MPRTTVKRLFTLALIAPVYVKAAALAPQQLDAGTRLLFANYKGNYWHAQRSGEQNSRQDSAFLSLQGGFNLGLWQFRQQGNLAKVQGDSVHWHSLQRYLQRPLVGIGSELSVGELYSSGRLFPALAYNGIELASDERMLSDNQRGYAPVVQGVAQSNARVLISQNGREIYQTSVSAGTFVIDDLSPTSYNGDLEVTVEEADGSVKRFSLPFAALPQSLRMGHSSYNLALGRTRDSAANSLFADAIYQYGLRNNLSVGSGLRLAEGYGRLVVDTVYSNALGAFDLNLSHSRAHLPNDQQRSGWLAGLSYSRTFAKSNTRVAIAGYRYSTEGYRELPQVQAERAAARGRKPRQTQDLQQQRSRLEVNLNQSLGDYGEVFIAAVRKDWRGSATDDQQWQLGYRKTWGNGISLGLSLLRQYSGTVKDKSGREETVTSLSVSIPLGSSGKTRVHSGFQHSTSNGAQYDTELLGQFSEYSRYNLGSSHSEQQRRPVLNAKLQQDFAGVNWQLAGSRGQDYWQLSSDLQGAVTLHSGGLTFGPPLSDTFALVKAKGAKGAQIDGYPQSRIDRNGYALVPHLSPYRYNRIALKSKDNVVQEQQIAPYAGATVKLHFRKPHKPQQQNKKGNPT